LDLPTKLHAAFTLTLVLVAPPSLSWAQEESTREAHVSHYVQAEKLWREGNAAEALRHFMTATKDPEVSFYASRQVALMGQYALPLLHQGLWHRDGIIQKQSAMIIGWTGERTSVEPLLMRMKFPDAPIEVEYALRKVGALTGEELLSIFDSQDLSNSALLDRKVASMSRLAGALRIPVDPVPLLDLVDTIVEVKAGELEEQPRGHLANARINLLRFLAERRVSGAAPHLVRAFNADADEANTAIAEALVELGAPSLEPLENAFRESDEESLRLLLGVVHYIASGARELSASRPISILLNEIQSDVAKRRRMAAVAARFSTKPNALMDWFRHHPDTEVRKALAPEGLSREALRSRQELKSYFLEKTRDSEPDVAAAHIRLVAGYLPDPQVESRLDQILGSRQELAVLRDAALGAAGRYGGAHLLRSVLERKEDPLRGKAVELSADRTEPELIMAVLALLREPEPSDAKRAAIRVAAQRWKRAEAKVPLKEILRNGDPLWREAARGLATLGAPEAVDYFMALIDSGRSIDPDEAGALYFTFSGIPARLTGRGPGSYRFIPLDIENRPPGDKVLVVLSEKSDYRGWIKVEERWENERSFFLDEGSGELTLYDRVAFEELTAGAGVVLLEDTVRQTVLDPMELSESRDQKIEVLSSLPAFPFAGLDGEKLRLLHRGEWITLGVKEDLRDASEASGWGRSAVVHLGFYDRESIRFSAEPPPSGWLRDEPQPVRWKQ
jgi:hypothetical protein